MKTSESKTHKKKDHEKIVSLEIRETNVKAIKLSEDEWKHTEVKPSTLKNVLGNCKNTAPGVDGISYQMIKTTIIRNIKKPSTNNSNIITIRTCTSSMENFNQKNDNKSRKRLQNSKRIQTIIINILPCKTVREHCKRTLGKPL